MTVSWLPGDPEAPPRVAFSISRKVGPATHRNLLRRRVRALLRDRATEVPAGSYLVGLAPASVGLPYGELGTALATAIARATRADPRRPEA